MLAKKARPKRHGTNVRAAPDPDAVGLHPVEGLELLLGVDAVSQWFAPMLAVVDREERGALPKSWASKGND
jgi:hypothetical protein